MKRYKNLKTDSYHYQILNNSNKNFYDKPIDFNFIEHTFCVGERLDLLAYKYFGAEDLWYVIALCNDIVDPFSISIGTKLKIPTDVKFVLNNI